MVTPLLLNVLKIKLDVKSKNLLVHKSLVGLVIEPWLKLMT